MPALCSIAYNLFKYANEYIFISYEKAYIDKLCAIAYYRHMIIIARTPGQIGDAIRRIRRERMLTQDALGRKMQARQATISKLEAGEPATQIRILTDALAALDLELAIQPRSQASIADIEEMF